MKDYFYVYILASQRNGTLYIGVTSNLIQRIYQHKQGLVDGFTKKYKVKLLVYYEQHDGAQSAIQREKQMKEWKRRWKLDLIEKNNPEWEDLYDEVTGSRPSSG
ncbi:MAG: GIY-YIG nuclease family protein [Alphaproteobacteria bacterium]